MDVNGIICAGGDSTVTLHGNVSGSYSGSGIIQARGNANVLLDGLNFQGNTVEDGGSVSAYDKSSLRITETNFTGNKASALRGGAAVQASGSSKIQIENSSFIANTAEKFSGGALFVNGTVNASISNCSFNHNQAVLRGGAVHGSENSTLSIRECSFHNNSVKHPLSWGAAVDGMDNATMTIEKCSFDKNTNAQHLGGALSLLSNVTMTVLDSTFTSNIARGGGAFHLNGNSSLKMSGCKLHSNSALEWGGAGYAEGERCSIHITNSSCTYNTAPGTGGCIIAQGACRLHIEDSHLMGNEGHHGGGALSLQAKTNTTLNNVMLTGNR
jgi:predicted outer membrane repeat protein